MNSCIVDGKVLDFKYKKLNEFTYAFYIGDIYIGQVFNMDTSWTAVGRPANDTKSLGPINGFKNRYYASEYLLLLTGYHNK